MKSRRNVLIIKCPLMYIYFIYVLFYVLFLSIVLFCILFVCKCVLYYSHRVSTQLHLNTSYHISYHITCVCVCVCVRARGRVCLSTNWQFLPHRPRRSGHSRSPKSWPLTQAWRSWQPGSGFENLFAVKVSNFCVLRNAVYKKYSSED